MYALIVNDVIQSVGAMPTSARRLDTQEWVLGLRTAPLALQRACGYYEIVETGQPAPSDPATMVVESTVELIEGQPTRVWTERPLSEDELTNRAKSQAPDTVAAIVARIVAEEIPALWVQPTGAHNAYLPGAIVLDSNGDRWRNDLGVANVWPVTEPHAHWTNLDAVDPTEPQPWVQPTGAHDAYAAGAVVTHNGQTWDNVHGDGNVWEPGVYGWTAR